MSADSSFGDYRDADGDRDVQTRCLCGHLLFIHTDESRRVQTGDEPPYGLVIERRGECLNATCRCKEPRASLSRARIARHPAASVDLEMTPEIAAAAIAAMLRAIDEASASDAA